MTPEQRSMRARLAAHVRWGNTPDRTGAEERNRKAIADRFYNQTHPALPHEQRLIAAQSLLQAHMLRMALKSSMARSRRRKSASTAKDEAR